jgi:hypothetical protein
MDAGWARWILEQYGYPFERVFPQRIDAGALRDAFDVLVFVDGGITPASARGGAQPAAADIPEEFRSHLGRVTAERSIPQLKAFMEAGGTVVAIGGSASALIEHLGLPVEDHLSEGGRALPRTTFYTPGSVLRARFDTAAPAAYGLREHTDVFFDDSPVFRFKAGAESAGLTRIGWFDSAAPLRSGWSWGESRLEHGVVAFEARVGRGRAMLFGPEILKRAQPHGTFKLLFNSLLLPAAP